MPYRSLLKTAVVMLAIISFSLITPAILSNGGSENSILGIEDRSNQLHNIREGEVFVRSDGTDTLTIDISDSLYDQWPAELIIKNPNGSHHQTLNIPPGDPMVPRHNIPLTKTGDYHLIINYQSRSYNFATTGDIVLQPNVRKRTFTRLGQEHRNRYYFHVPDDTNFFTVFGFISESTSTDNWLHVYDPDGNPVRQLTIPYEKETKYLINRI